MAERRQGRTVPARPGSGPPRPRASLFRHVRGLADRSLAQRAGWLFALAAAAVASRWWVASTLGVLVVAPAVLAWAEPAPEHGQRPGRGETVLAACSVAVSALVLLGTLPSAPGAYPAAFLLVPALLRCSVRLGARGAATSVLLLALVAVPATLSGRGPFGAWLPDERPLLIQLLLFVIAITCLVFAAVTSQRRNAEHVLERLASRTATSTGQAFRGTLVAEGAARLPARRVLVGSVSEGRVRTVAAWPSSSPPAGAST